FATEKLETIEEKSCQALQELAPLYNALSEK
ncbi:HI_0552 family protein, partial [Enterococcus faecalis]